MEERLSAIYDTYLGWRCRRTSLTKARKYTPKTFAESLGLKAEDYVSLTSYTHHPFYSQSLSRFRTTGVMVCPTIFRLTSSWL